MADGKSLSHLTRSLMLGASVGTIALTQVGCATVPGTNSTGSGNSGATQNAPVSASEKELCDRALASRQASDVDTLMRQHTNAGCIVPLLSALPPTTLGALSSSALGGLSRNNQLAIPSRVLAQLPPSYRRARAEQRSMANRNSNSNRGSTTY